MKLHAAGTIEPYSPAISTVDGCSVIRPRKHGITCTGTSWRCSAR